MAAMLLVNLLLGSACASVAAGPLNVSLAQLTTDEGAYDERKVITQGTVRQFQDPDSTVYEVIEDGDANRVELLPASAATGYVGHRVEVMGTFHVDDQGGRSISVERVTLPGG